MEAFIERHIADRTSFTFETALRSVVTLEQARSARNAGFFLSMIYVALESVDLHLERVAVRASRGGHSAPPARIREIHSASMSNLSRALLEFDLVRVYDNSGPRPLRALICRSGVVSFLLPEAPEWIRHAVESMHR